MSEQKWVNDNHIVSFRGREIDETKPVRLYRNLLMKGVWYSLVQRGVVVGHTTAICLKACIFHVNETARQRIIKKKKKEFHAYVEGMITGSGMGTTALRNDLPAEIKYNPYVNDQFTCYNLTQKPFVVKKARFIIANNEGVKGAYLNC